MARRFTQAEKEKSLAPPTEPPRVGRVKVPDFDNSDLMKQHNLTIIGRVRNPKIQRLWSLLPFFTEHWKTSSPPVGADLVQGVPVHMWNEAMLRSIREDLGTFESSEITKAHAKMRVHVNGLLPLLKTYTLGFANGDEVIATPVYEKLEKHCSHCSLLDHEIEEGPELTKGDEETRHLPPLPQQRRNEVFICNLQSSGVKHKRDEVVYPTERRKALDT
ncbi:unnamed protein product [Microthlaspi erraticum]|uniref:DUF4283 domain-containing protein n=1 Tax=Microthlaspi erraticum TaxID=1685480 RepID=A0A6D2KT12_9BRAS|nr:unnamed protein product [Microthlaspi erraticum]